jgi:hypothetical protein
LITASTCPLQFPASFLSADKACCDYACNWSHHLRLASSLSIMFWSSFIFQRGSEFHSFSWLSSISSYVVCITIYSLFVCWWTFGLFLFLDYYK